MNRKLLIPILTIILLPVIITAQDISGELEIFTTYPEPGEEIKALLKIENINFTGYRTDVHVKYSILDPQGGLVISESGTFPVTDSRDIVLNLYLPTDASPGIYSFVAEMTSHEGTAVFDDTFELPGSENFIMLYVTVVIIAFIFGIIFVARRKG